MKYFNTLPQIYISDGNGNFLLATNLLARSEIIPSLLNNPMLFYSYDIQESDTPESIANKYYGDPYRYWLVLFANQIIDPQAQWPMTSQEFNDYMLDKYGPIIFTVEMNVVTQYTQINVQEYTKTITTIDGLSGLQTTNTFIIDLPTYTALQETTTTRTFPDGNSVTQIITKAALSIYDWETQQNEAKRKINLINSNYVSLLESQLIALMST